MIVKMNGVPIQPPVDAIAGTHVYHHPWWDLAGNLQDGLTEWAHNLVHDLGVSLSHVVVDGLSIGLPTLAIIGILWWMCPFLPKADKAPKLTGTSLLAYMFYIMIRGAYFGG